MQSVRDVTYQLLRELGLTTIFGNVGSSVCDAARLDDLDAIKRAAVAAWSKSKPTVIEIPISAQVPPLV